MDGADGVLEGFVVSDDGTDIYHHKYIKYKC
jgi:hypothetical protein